MKTSNFEAYKFLNLENFKNTKIQSGQIFKILKFNKFKF